MAARLAQLPSSDDLRDQLAARRGLRTDPRNTKRRARYLELHPRDCLRCGLDLTGKYVRRCTPCQGLHELKQRTCAGLHGVSCDEDVTGTRRQRCLYHQILREDQVRTLRNQRRRKSR